MDPPDEQDHHSSAEPRSANASPKHKVIALHPSPLQPATVHRNDNETSPLSKYRRLDREPPRASTIETTGSRSGGRFLFVDSSTSQRPRSDQRAINAHIQQTAHRNRRQAAAQRLRGTANIGRYRRDLHLQPRPPDPQNVDQQLLSPRASGTSLHQQSLPATPSSSISLEQESGELAQQLIRLRHYGAVRELEVRQAFNEQEHDDERRELDVGRRMQNHNASAESSSVKTLLTQILQRLDTDNLGHAIHGRTANVLSNTVLDPFGTSSAPITPGMDVVLRHCKSQCPPLNVCFKWAGFSSDLVVRSLQPKV